MIPQRTCIGCRRRDDQDQLMRLVRVGQLIVDGSRPRLAGRGAYLHPACLDLAVQRRALRRAFGDGAHLDPSIGVHQS
ncbi:MAG TPA: YlxR family protein [Arachnia sp.]|jgi:predicted RNA-binding protein YlxR (DUF448 family)|nr:YlxR family protein [Arachnia sp.]